MNDDRKLRDRVNAAAENAWLKLVGRASMVSAIPAVIGAAILIGREIVAATNANTAQLMVIQEKLRGVDRELQNNMGLLGQRLDAIDRRNDQQDIRIESIQQRVWTLPTARTP